MENLTPDEERMVKAMRDGIVDVAYADRKRERAEQEGRADSRVRAQDAFKRVIRSAVYSLREDADVVKLLAEVNSKGEQRTLNVSIQGRGKHFNPAILLKGFGVRVPKDAPATGS